MTAVTSTTDFDYEFDAAKGIQRDNLPPFAQRMRKAADLVWEEGYQQPFIRELGEGTLQRERFALCERLRQSARFGISQGHRP